MDYSLRRAIPKERGSFFFFQCLPLFVSFVFSAPYSVFSSFFLFLFLVLYLQTFETADVFSYYYYYYYYYFIFPKGMLFLLLLTCLFTVFFFW